MVNTQYQYQYLQEAKDNTQYQYQYCQDAKVNTQYQYQYRAQGQYLNTNTRYCWPLMQTCKYAFAKENLTLQWKNAYSGRKSSIFRKWF